MKKIYPVFLMLIIHYSLLPAQNNKMDSMLAVLKTGKNDTNRVNTMNNLSKLYMDKAMYSIADSLAVKAITLSEKLNYENGSMIAYNLAGNMDFYQSRYSKALNNYRL